MRPTRENLMQHPEAFVRASTATYKRWVRKATSDHFALRVCQTIFECKVLYPTKQIEEENEGWSTPQECRCLCLTLNVSDSRVNNLQIIRNQRRYADLWYCMLEESRRDPALEEDLIRFSVMSEQLLRVSMYKDSAQLLYDHWLLTDMELSVIIVSAMMRSMFEYQFEEGFSMFRAWEFCYLSQHWLPLLCASRGHLVSAWFTNTQAFYYMTMTAQRDRGAMEAASVALARLHAISVY